LDPTVRQIITSAANVPAAQVFATLNRLTELRRAAEQVFVGADALLLPVTPGHPTLAAVAADPVGVNAGLGTYTNMVNLFDLCAVAGALRAGIAWSRCPVRSPAPVWCAIPPVRRTTSNSRSGICRRRARGTLLPTVAPPLALGPVTLDDGSTVPGFIAAGLDGLERDITIFGGRRSWPAARER
jgi:allophanate hydrolase